MATSSERQTRPVRVRGRRRACSNSRFEVYLDDVVDAAGHAVPDYLVVAPRARAARGVTGVAVLPEADGRLGLLRVYRHAVGAYQWEAPRGFIDAGESAPEAATRELWEETGLRCPAARLRSLGAVTPDAGVLDARVLLFAAPGCTARGAILPAELGHAGFRWFARAELEAMVSNGEVEDGITLAACYRHLGGAA